MRVLAAALVLSTLTIPSAHAAECGEGKHHGATAPPSKSRYISDRLEVTEDRRGHLRQASFQALKLERRDLAQRWHKWNDDLSTHVEHCESLARAAAVTTSYTGYVGTGGTLASIRACESGGNYSAVSASGTYRGAYQFDQQTWESVGGSGDPAAASPAEQDRRASILMAQRGTQPWPVCGLGLS